MGDELPAPTQASGAPIYNVPFAWDSSHGHMVELLGEHIAPGLIVDIGCGYAPHAERLRQRGFGYVGIDADPDAVAHLRDRGFGAELADANDLSALVGALDAVAADGDVAAVLALDVLEHLVSPHITLAEITSWMRRRSVTVFGASLPNVTHDDVVLKLMTGRFDMTPSGLLDHTHLRFFTDASVTAMMKSVGLEEQVRHDVCSPKTDQQWPEVHPALSDGALLGTYLRRARALSDPHGQTFQFVRLYDVADDSAGGTDSRTGHPTLLASRPPVPERCITVLIDASCSEADAASVVASLSEQQGLGTVRRLAVGDDTASVIGEVETSYVSLVSGGERFGEHWAAQMLATADRYPAAVIRCGPLATEDTDLYDVDWLNAFALFEHYLADGTPSAAVAYPTAFLRELSSVWSGTVDDITPHALLLEASAVCGVVDTGTGAVAPRHGWRADDETVAASLATLAGAPMLAPFGAAAEIASTLAKLHAAEEQLAQVTAEAEQLRNDTAWLNSELARTPVKATRKAMSFVNRVRNRIR